MATRPFPVAAPGSLLKGFKSGSSEKPIEEAPKKKSMKSSEGKQKKASRERNEAHLALIRQCPCVACGREPSEAAHIRQAAPGKPPIGMGMKPDDKFTVPLCHRCHMRQHEVGEKPFFEAQGIDPLLMAAALFSKSPDLLAMRKIAISGVTSEDVGKAEV